MQRQALYQFLRSVRKQGYRHQFVLGIVLYPGYIHITHLQGFQSIVCFHFIHIRVFGNLFFVSTGTTGTQERTQCQSQQASF